MMKVASSLLVVLCPLTIHITKIYARSVLQKSIDLSPGYSLEDDESSFIHNSISSCRHRLEHSTNFQALRWSLRKVQQTELCEFCELIIPVFLLCSCRLAEHTPTFDSSLNGSTPVVIIVDVPHTFANIDECPPNFHHYTSWAFASTLPGLPPIIGESYIGEVRRSHIYFRRK
ncbi:unnamed protein product [Rotaria socialis]|uniref:Uncharacterized protein n=1 Tax=Rotaria socialis TaxID=392032 RepID=A0A820ZWP1_9BILA|nr:unnamed protein product [Rotaria socialis]CAF3526101.1 unnamed protein product [Rotaria socialis]CAF4572039.1 unnamed protein product [Rotaria socialis]